MKMFLAAAAVMAFGSLGVACASEGLKTTSSPSTETKGKTDLSARPPAAPSRSAPPSAASGLIQRALPRSRPPGDPPVVAGAPTKN
ncbi:MAG: hypothetical protein U0174_23360 [Polyangiaceae bacterium]